jgi:hypothetical protein
MLIIKPFCLVLLILSAACIQNCNFSSHSYNFGKLLKPGNSFFITSVGNRHIPKIDTVRVRPITRIHDTTFSETNSLSYALNYRLGFAENKIFKEYIDIGFLLELPVSNDDFFFSQLEFDIRAGLPGPQFKIGKYYHNIKLGWGLGEWVDNTLFAEYGAGFEIRHSIFYANFRFNKYATELAADSIAFEMANQDIGLGRINDSKAQWNGRFSAGICYHLPAIKLLPDAVIPEVSIIYPGFNRISSAGFLYHLGLYWGFD